MARSAPDSTDRSAVVFMAEAEVVSMPAEAAASTAGAEVAPTAVEAAAIVRDVADRGSPSRSMSEWRDAPVPARDAPTASAPLRLGEPRSVLIARFKALVSSLRIGGRPVIPVDGISNS